MTLKLFERAREGDGGGGLNESRAGRAKGSGHRCSGFWVILKKKHGICRSSSKLRKNPNFSNHPWGGRGACMRVRMRWGEFTSV